MRKPCPACVFLAHPKSTTDLNGRRPKLVSVIRSTMHRFSPLEGPCCVKSLSVGISAKAALCRNVLHERCINGIVITLLKFLKLEPLLDDVPTIGKVFHRCMLQRSSIRFASDRPSSEQHKTSRAAARD
jgi:hypothetical protein